MSDDILWDLLKMHDEDRKSLKSKMEKTPNRWDELEPGVQLALSRLINHIASMPNQHMCLDAVLDGMTVDEFRESLRRDL